MSHCRVIATAQQPNYRVINVPLLIVTGSDDLTGPLFSSKMILEKYATKESEKSIKDLSGIGHWHCVEAPADVEGLVNTFIENLG